MQVRRLNAITRKLQACLKKIAYQVMTPAGEADLRSDSGYRRLSGDAEDEVRGHGIRGGKPATAWTRARWQARRPSCRRALQLP
eukprot:8988977-Pyramimonas_sp.AAC.1